MWLATQEIKPPKEEEEAATAASPSVKEGGGEEEDTTAATSRSIIGIYNFLYSFFIKKQHNISIGALLEEIEKKSPEQCAIARERIVDKLQQQQETKPAADDDDLEDAAKKKKRTTTHDPDSTGLGLFDFLLAVHTRTSHNIHFGHHVGTLLEEIEKKSPEQCAIARKRIVNITYKAFKLQLVDATKSA